MGNDGGATKPLAHNGRRRNNDNMSRKVMAREDHERQYDHDEMTCIVLRLKHNTSFRVSCWRVKIRYMYYR